MSYTIIKTPIELNPGTVIYHECTAGKISQETVFPWSGQHVKCEEGMRRSNCPCSTSTSPAARMNVSHVRILHSFGIAQVTLFLVKLYNLYSLDI